MADAAGVHRRTVGRNGHGHRRDDRALDDDLQRAGDAATVALEGAGAVDAHAISRACSWASAAARSSALMILGYAYYRVAGEAYALVSIGLVSFAAVAQFAPAMLGGMYWKGGTRAGAIAGLAAGFIVWGYTLLLPSFAKSGWLPITFIDQGLFGLAFLKPQQLFGPTTARPDCAFAVLEHARESGRLCRRVAVRPAERERAHAGAAVR